MARGRMIDNCISISEKINDLSLKEAFIYTWIIPHLDDWGRISGSPRTIKALVFPMKKEISISNIDNAIRKFSVLGLFLWDEINGELVLQQPFEEFSSHQSISEGKRAKSKYPEILSTNIESPRIPKNPQESPAQVSIREVNIREENIYDLVITYLNEKAERKYKNDTPKTIQFINARINEGFTLDDFKKVIDIKTSQWKSTEYDKYLRPETLFGTKFESYLNEKIDVKPKVSGGRKYESY